MDVHGFVAAGFKDVERAFRANFAERGELGAAVAVFRGSEPLVDLWGGVRDRESGAPWEADTLVGVFSSTKGVSAAVLALAVARGHLALDEPVASYWPEFAANDKGTITVRQLFAHQAGLPALDERITPELLGDLDRLARALARQSPEWQPGTRHGYHGLTLGFYQNELLRRTDPKRRTIGAFLRDEVTSPLGVTFHVGLPADFPAARLAALESFGFLRLFVSPGTMPFGMTWRLGLPWTLTFRALANIAARGPADLVGPRFRGLELPSGNGVGSARALARIYGALAVGGAELGLDAATFEELKAPARTPAGGERDAVLHARTAYSLGFSKPGGILRFGSSASAFGTAGAGGSFGYADPDLGIGYGYVANRMGLYLFDDPREKSLRESVERCARAAARVAAG